MSQLRAMWALPLYEKIWYSIVGFIYVYALVVACAWLGFAVRGSL